MNVAKKPANNGFLKFMLELKKSKKMNIADAQLAAGEIWKVCSLDSVTFTRSQLCI